MTTTAGPDVTSDQVNLAHWVHDRATSSPDAVAVRQGPAPGRGRPGPPDLRRAGRGVGRVRGAAARASGVEPGDRVALIVPNVVAFPVAYYAILRAGAVVVPMNPLLKAGEVAYTWQDCGARVAVVFALFAETARAAAETTGTQVVVVGPDDLGVPADARRPGRPRRSSSGPPRDTAVILYTSGTTGRPKGAELSFANLRSNTLACVETLFLNGPDDVLFGGLPLFHSFGQTCALNASVAGGSCLTLLPRFDPREALETVARDGVTVFLGRADHVHGAARGREGRPVARRARRDGPVRGVGRLVAAGRGAARGRGDLRPAGARGLRAVGDLPGRVLQPPRPAEQGGFGGHRHPRRGARARPAPAGGRGRGRRGVAARSTCSTRATRTPSGRSWSAARTSCSATGPTPTPPPRRCATAGSTPATSPGATPTATTSSSTG